MFNSVEIHGTILHEKELASAVNKTFIAATATPLSENDKIYMDQPGASYCISGIAIESHLKKINPNKAPDPNGIPNWIFNTFSIEHSEPFSTLLLIMLKFQSRRKKYILFRSLKELQ